MKAALRAGLVPALAVLALPTPASEETLSPEAARQLQESGAIHPLDRLLEPVMRRFPQGRLVETELYPAGEEVPGGGPVYEVEILDGAGRVHELMIDARNGAILDAEQED